MAPVAPHPAAITVSPAEPIDPAVASRPATAVMVPSPTAAVSSTPTPAPTATPTPPQLPSPVPAPAATPIPTPLPAEPTPTETPAGPLDPVSGWVAAAIPARGINADQFRVGENVYVATEFRDVPSGATVGIAWYRDGVEVSVWESGPQFGFERANFAFFRVVSIAVRHTVSILINGQAFTEAAFTVTE